MVIGLLIVILIGFLVENLLFPRIGRKTVIRLWVSAGHGPGAGRGGPSVPSATNSVNRSGNPSSTLQCRTAASLTRLRSAMAMATPRLLRSFQ